METKRDLVLKQIALQKEMQQAGFNIVDCGNCGELNIHKTGNEKIICWSCEEEMSLSDCPDHWYSGMENNKEFREDFELIIDEMERPNGDIVRVELRKDGLLVATNISSGESYLGGFKRELKDIPQTVRERIIGYCYGEYRNLYVLTEKEVILEDSEVVWFDDIEFEEYSLKDVENVFGVELNKDDTFHSAMDKLEIDNNIFYSSMCKKDVTDSVMNEWEVARTMELRYICIKDLDIHLATY